MASEQPISPNLVPPVEPGFATAAESLRVGLPAPTLDLANLVIVPNTHGRPAVELDESLDQLKDAETVFFKQQTGIQDDGALKAHLLSIQAEAYKVHPYPCIRRFSWAKLKISRLFPYQDLLKLGREREGAIFLDIGCCFGNDVGRLSLTGILCKM
ncbi:hypothetical protein BC834DRAFT_43972 [Gloeopeniophorella convolvens]|nr:hypothetical protein BC834DRAFT_43972 [Gloeopeniophorella convolvens]